LPDRSIGSYRPIPDLVWRAFWAIGARDQSPFLHHWVNVLLHGVNGALVTLLALRLTKDRLTAWLSGGAFVACAVLTEAVSGVVGIADVLGALGALLALAALALPLTWMPLAVFGATLFGLFSKESALVCVPLVPFCALLTAQITHPHRPLRWARAGASALAAGAAFVLYVELRRRLFPAPIQAEYSVAANEGKPAVARAMAAALRWYAQPALPRDPLNNPFIHADFVHRVSGALRVYERGLSQIVLPWTLSGDYSSPQEPIPVSLYLTPRAIPFTGKTIDVPESVFGALLMILPVLASFALGVLGWRGWTQRMREREEEERLHVREGELGELHAVAPRVAALEDEPVDLRPVVGACLMWIVVSYFPVSNIPVILPTVRAERFWYFPAIATSVLLGIAFRQILERAHKAKLFGVGIAAVALFFAFQCFAARRHAVDYTDDLAFWDATRRAVPNSAKAHLNYSVMQGARGRLDIRLESNRRALELAPEWPMANVYLGDTLCRLHRSEEAWPYYARGFELAPNDVNLVALGLQCLWDEHQLEEDSERREELIELAEKHPRSWLEFLERDLIENGEDNGGVDPKYRPRGYNQGPKE
jgi:tetratricopeptide (TPR) repeat protein